ncbi:MAG: hypothetical protein MJE77_29400 [Proteobacteria bacterium]|nr:hypothetical protein [Pseudomonadota bacterium]
MSDQTKQSDCPQPGNPAQAGTPSEPPESATKQQSAAANDPLVARLTALLDAYAASRKAKEQQSKQPEIPADVPRFVTDYPWAN